MNLKEGLAALGLSKGEAEIYLALLHMGSSTATKLSQETGIHRTYIYDVIEKLRERGMVSQTEQEAKKRFQAENPKSLHWHLLEKVNLAERIIPELQKLKATEEETHVEVYKGTEGIKTVIYDLLETSKDYCGIGAFKEFERVLPAFLIRHMLKRVFQQNIRGKIILEEGTHIMTTKLEEFRYLPSTQVMLSSFLVYGSKVVIFVWAKPYFQIRITNAAIAQSYHAQFQLLWSLSKAGNKKQ